MSKSAHELTRKDMKAPDKFQVAATQAAGWATGHRRQIVVAAAAAGALVVLVAGILAWRSSQAQKAGGMLFRTLTAAGGEISSVPLPNVSGPLYKSDAERQQAVIQAATTLRDRYGSTDAATTASLAEADAHFRLGAWDNALKGYQAFLAGASKDDPLRFAALDGVARVQEVKGQLAEAAKTWEQAGEVKAFADRAALERARVLAAAGQPDEAKKILGGFGEAFKDSRLRAEADRLLAKLSAGGK